MYNLLILSSPSEGNLPTLYEQIKYLEKYNISVTLSITPTEIELLKILNENNFDCAYVHVKHRFISNSSKTYDPIKVLEQKNVPLLGNSYITQLLIADKYTTSKSSGIGLPNWVISRTAYEQKCFSWDDVDLFPVIVKPNTLHASMGITEASIVYSQTRVKELVKNLFDEFSFLNEVLIEKYAYDGQEYMVSVLGNGDSLACSVTKLKYRNTDELKINSHKQKNMPLHDRSFILDIENDISIRERLEYHAKTLYRHFGMKDIARFDFILDKTYYLIEANTNPMPGNSFSWEWQVKYNLKVEQIVAMFLCTFHYGQVASGRPSRLPLKLINSLPTELIQQICDPYVAGMSPECSGITDNCLRTHLFTMNDRVSSETEVHSFLKALTRVLKPQFILETGTFKGSSTIAFAEGLRQNGSGHMVTLEVEENLAKQAMKLLAEYPVKVFHQYSLSYIPEKKIDLLFLDSKRDLRGQEFEHFKPYLNSRAMIVWHDSSYRIQNHSVYDYVEQLYQAEIIDRLLLPTPRGLTLSMLRE